jgi:hypothetical protein
VITFCTFLTAALACMAPGSPPAEPPDLSKLDRSIKKEPAYTAKQPLYGLAVFGPRADAKVWMVLDKSAADRDTYDVLHIDLNADGDLTGAGERLDVGEGGKFRVGVYKDPATGVAHTGFAVGIQEKGGATTVMLSLRWRGKYDIGGGYPEDPDSGYMRFAAKPADAPVVWAFGDGPLRFQRWYGAKLAIGRDEDFRVFLGQPGRGPSTFCAVREHILPAGATVKATLVYRDEMGKEQRAVCELKERC